MADVFSNLYLALAVEYYDRHNPVSKTLTEYIINKLLNENQMKINKVIDNLGKERFILKHLHKTS